jgi:hypothetical protein
MTSATPNTPWDLILNDLAEKAIVFRNAALSNLGSHALYCAELARANTPAGCEDLLSQRIAAIFTAIRSDVDTHLARVETRVRTERY